MNPPTYHEILTVQDRVHWYTTAAALDAPDPDGVASGWLVRVVDGQWHCCSTPRGFGSARIGRVDAYGMLDIHDIFKHNGAWQLPELAYAGVYGHSGRCMAALSNGWVLVAEDKRPMLIEGKPDGVSGCMWPSPLLYIDARFLFPGETR